MKTIYFYACSDYPGMEDCPGKVQAQTEAELWQLMEVHAKIAHGEIPRIGRMKTKYRLKH